MEELLSLVEHSQLQVEIDPPRRNSGLMPVASPAAPTVSDSSPYHGEHYRKMTSARTSSQPLALFQLLRIASRHGKNKTVNHVSEQEPM